MTDTSFTTFIRDHAQVTPNAEGDFIEDARLLIELGRFSDASTWDRFEWHLVLRRASPEAVAAARRVFHRRYLPWVRRQH